MAGEYIDSVAIARDGARSLTTDIAVNGLPYNRIMATAVRKGAMAKDEQDLIAPVILVYYPAGIISDDVFSAGFQLGEGQPVDDEVVQGFIESGCGQSVLNQFVKNSAVAAIVDFAREAHHEGIGLVEARQRELREYQAPLAAVAIQTSDTGYAATLLSPYFVWPWVAFGEMKKIIEP